MSLLINFERRRGLVNRQFLAGKTTSKQNKLNGVNVIMVLRSKVDAVIQYHFIETTNRHRGSKAQGVHQYVCWSRAMFEYVLVFQEHAQKTLWLLSCEKSIRRIDGQSRHSCISSNGSKIIELRIVVFHLEANDC